MISKKRSRKEYGSWFGWQLFSSFFIIFFKDLFLFYVWVSACMCLVCIPWTIECSGNRVSDFLELELPLVLNLLRVFGIEPGSSGAAIAPKGLLTVSLCC